MNAALLLIPVVAVLAPLAARGLGRWVRVPIVVFEIVLGIVIGPSVLGWAQPSPEIGLIAGIGLAMLFFVAGTEIEFAGLRGRTGIRAVAGWLLSLALGLGIGLLVAGGEAAVVIAIALCSTALGTILPILRDAGELTTGFGRSVMAVGAVGEFGPLVAISVFLGARAPGPATVVLGVFIVIAGLAVVAAFTVPRGALHSVVESSLHTSGQFAVRVILLILGALAFLSALLGLDMLLGAFVAGIIWSLLMRDASAHTREAVESKVEAIAFGFLVPVFFVYTGVTFQLAPLLADPLLWLAVVAVAAVLLVVRGIPASLAAPAAASLRERAAVAFFGATALPVIVAVTAIGTHAGVIPAVTATVLVAAGMVSVLLYPLIALSLRGAATTAPAGGTGRA